MENPKNIQQVVAIGYIGSGKTTLFNKCCNKKQEIQSGGDSVTKNAFLTCSAYGRGFKMLDTPGLGADKSRMDHTIGIVNALSEGDIHMILVVIKFDRLPLMKRFLSDIINFKLSRFKNLITVAVTHWDKVLDDIKQNENPQELFAVRMNEIQEYLKSINVHSSIYVSKTDTGNQVCRQIDQILKQNLNGQQCQISTTEISAYFDLIDETDDIQKRLIDKSGFLIKDFRKKCITVKKWINAIDNNHPQLSDLMHYLTLEMKDLAESTVVDFEKKHMMDFYQLYEENEEVIYAIHSKLKYEIVEELKKTQECAQKKMYNSKLHVYNFIKQCPNCKLIWFKVYGCPYTQCGEFPSSDDGKFSQQSIIRRFKFQISDTTVNFQDLGAAFQLNSKQYSLGNKKGLGCGQALNWDQLKGLDENQIKELCDPGVIDYFAQVDLKLKNKSKKLEDQIQHAKKQFKVQYI